MNYLLAARIAFRYLLGKRSANAVPVLSRISMLAIAVGSAAMIVLFSVFNGFEGIVKDLYKAFYPDIRITAVHGKFFESRPGFMDSIAHLPGVLQVAPVIEDNVLVSSDNEQVVVTLKGVDNRYFAVNNLRQYISSGRDSLVMEGAPTAIVGESIAGRMGFGEHNDFNELRLHYPNSKSDNMMLNPTEAFQSLDLRPDGFFHVQDEFDDKYVLAPINLTQQLFQEPGRLSAIEIKLKDGVSATDVQQMLRQIAGKGFRVETRFEQNHTLYQVMRTEKWATYAIMLFVLLIASVNMIGALALLVLEKRKDMAILSAMGATRQVIQLLFLMEGLLWALTGGVIGMLLGAALCWGQQHFGWIQLNGSFIIKSYPVSMQITDFLLVIVTVVIVGLLAAWYPSRRAAADNADDTIYARLR